MKISVLAALLFCGAAALAKDYTTYIGDAFPYYVAALTTDPAGNTYITGSRASAASNDIFVTKLDPSGDLLLTFTISGKGTDQANAIALDPSGNIWIVGYTSSQNFPLRNPVQLVPGQGTAILLKLDPTGALLLSTYLGGTKGFSALNAVAVDAHGDVYVTGTTTASDYPRTPGLPADTASSGPFGPISAAWFAKISAAGDKILYAGALSATGHACGGSSSCFLGPIQTAGAAIAVDASGNAYIAGNTYGGGIAGTPGALLTTGIGAFVAKINPAGAGLGYLTFLGTMNYVETPASNPANMLSAIAADASGNVYLAGSTNDPNFPATPNAVQATFTTPNPYNTILPAADAFAAKLNSSGSALIWASYLGGTAADRAQALAADSAGNLWVAGTTASPGFPNVSGIAQGGDFLVEFNASGTALPFSARFPSGTIAAALALDAAGTLHSAGSAGIVSTLTPSATSAPHLVGIGNAAGGSVAGRVAPGELISLYGLHLAAAPPASANFDASGFLPTTFGGVQVTIGGIPAPLLYVSETQINAIVPLKLTSPATVQLQLTSNGTPLSGFRLQVDPVAPQIFRNADGSAAAVNQDGSINSASHPAKVGSIVAIWATGTGAFSGLDGQQVTEASGIFICSCSIGSGYPVYYAGTAPGLVTGVTQINFQVAAPPPEPPPYFSLSVGSASSLATFVYTTP